MTESRLAQETLRESEQLARGIIDTALDAFVQIDERACIRDWNSQAENIFGWSRDEALGKNVFDLMGQPDGKDRSRRPWKHFLLSGDEVGPSAPPRTPGQAAGRQGDHGRAEHHRAENARRLRVQRLRPRPHRQDRGRGPDPAGREDGGDRPAHRRHRARLQQHPDRDHRNDRNPGRRGQGRTAARRHHQDDRRGRVARRRPHPASAGLRAQAAAAAARDRRQHADHRHRETAAARRSASRSRSNRCSRTRPVRRSSIPISSPPRSSISPSTPATPCRTAAS